MFLQYCHHQSKSLGQHILEASTFILTFSHSITPSLHPEQVFNKFTYVWLHHIELVVAWVGSI